jgi:magnesium transporter
MATSVPDHHLSEPITAHAHQDFVRLSAGETLGAALRRIRYSRIEGRIAYFYVVDEEDRLQGVVPTRNLLLNPPDALVGDIMQRGVIAIPRTATLLDACEFFIQHRLLALPVVDEDRHIVGVVDVELYTDEISDLFQKQEYDDIFQIIGVRLARVRQASISAAVRGRLPWLLCNVAGGLACAAMASLFEAVLAEVVVLAMFLPVVLALAESVSIQSLTLGVHVHETGSPRWGAALGRLRREAAAGLLLGLACGGIVGTAAMAQHRAPVVALVIFASITLSVTTAAIFGLSLPVALRAARRDLALASGPIVLAMTDVATLLYYLGLAAAMLR